MPGSIDLLGAISEGLNCFRENYGPRVELIEGSSKVVESAIACGDSVVNFPRYTVRFSGGGN